MRRRSVAQLRTPAPRSGPPEPRPRRERGGGDRALLPRGLRHCGPPRSARRRRRRRRRARSQHAPARSARATTPPLRRRPVLRPRSRPPGTPAGRAAAPLPLSQRRLRRLRRAGGASPPPLVGRRCAAPRGRRSRPAPASGNAGPAAKGAIPVRGCPPGLRRRPAARSPAPRVRSGGRSCVLPSAPRGTERRLRRPRPPQRQAR